MSDEIPTDIRETARKTLQRWFRGGREELADAFAAVLLAERKAERERCAKIAEHLNGWGADCGRGGHAEHIAKVIRAASIRNPETEA